MGAGGVSREEELGPESQGVWAGYRTPLNLSFLNPVLPALLGRDREVLMS